MKEQDKRNNNPNTLKLISQRISDFYKIIADACKKECIGIHRITLKYRYYISPKRHSRIVPHISLSGLWLKKAGFQIGDTLTITIKKECLVIRKDKKQEQNH